MTNLIGLELLKLRTVRAPWVLLGLSQLLIVGGVTGLVLSSDTLRTATAATDAVAHAGLASLFTLVLGIMAVAGEYRNLTITDTFLSTPRRARVIGAKLVAYAIAGASFAVANAVTAVLATRVWWSVKGVPLDLGDADLWRTVAGCAGWNVAFAVVGVGVGALLRNLTAAIAAALAWIALVEGIVGQLVGNDVARWLPFAAGSALGHLPGRIGDLGPVSQLAAATALAGYAAVFAMVAVTTTVRRDVT
jgi:ABC-2 type transport system permease protein